MMQLVHCAMMVPINSNLLLALAVGYGERGANLYFSRVRDCSKKCPNDSRLFMLSSEIVIKDREKGNRMNGDRRNLGPKSRRLINVVRRANLQTHAWLGVEPKACW